MSVEEPSTGLFLDTKKTISWKSKPTQRRVLTTLSNGNVSKSKLHYTQMQVYMLGRKLERALYISSLQRMMIELSSGACAS